MRRWNSREKPRSTKEFIEKRGHRTEKKERGRNSPARKTIASRLGRKNRKSIREFGEGDLKQDKRLRKSCNWWFRPYILKNQGKVKVGSRKVLLGCWERTVEWEAQKNLKTSGIMGQL